MSALAARIRRPDVCEESLKAYSACFGGAHFCETVSDPDHFFHCCQRHGLLACLYQKAQGQGWLDPVLEQSLAEAYRDQFFSYAVYRELLDSLHERLLQADLRVVLLKGAALWFGRYAPPMLRHVSDIDILVIPGQRRQVVDVLISMGLRGDPDGKSFKDARERRVDLHDEKLGIIEENSGVTVEAILRDSRPIPEYSQYLVMDPELETTYLALHAMKHSYLRFIWLNDIVLSAAAETAPPQGSLARKVRAWAFYLHDFLLRGSAADRHGLNPLEAYLARRMLVVDQHPLGKLLLAFYQPTPAKAWRCLVESARRDGDRVEDLPRRLGRLVKELFAGSV